MTKDQNLEICRSQVNRLQGELKLMSKENAMLHERLNKCNSEVCFVHIRAEVVSWQRNAFKHGCCTCCLKNCAKSKVKFLSLLIWPRFVLSMLLISPRRFWNCPVSVYSKTPPRPNWFIPNSATTLQNLFIFFFLRL